MKRMVIISLLAMFTVMQVQAQQIKLEYENKIDSLPELMQQYFEMQKVQHSRLTIKGSSMGSEQR